MNPNQVSWLGHRVRPSSPLIAGLAGMILFATWVAAAPTPRSVWGGVYTPEQANRGKTAYAEYCANCHGFELRGGHESPALTGDRFLTKWNNHSVDELLENVRVTMPADKPGTLSRQENSDILRRQ